MIDPDSQPEIIIFTHRETFVEPAQSTQQFLRHHNRGGTHQAEIETPPENITGRLRVFALGVHPHPAANPDLLGLADLNFIVLLHEPRLDFKFFGQPKVVRVQKRYIPSPCHTETIVACGRHAASLLYDKSDTGTVLRQMLSGPVVRAVIDDNKLPSVIALRQHRFDGLSDHGPTIIGGNNDAYDREHDASRSSIVLASLLNETFYLLEKLIQHHPGYAVQHSLPDTGYQSPHLRIRAVFEHRLTVVLLQVYGHVALHKSRPAGPLAAENVVRRRLFVLDGNLSFVSSLDRSDANLHSRFVSIRRNFAHVLTSRHTLGHDLRIEQHLPDFLPRRVKCIVT